MRRVFCFGDSNVYGFDPRSYFGGRYDRDTRWTALLRRYGWEAINAGENGLQIPAADWEFWEIRRAVMASLPLDAILVMLGGNDLLCHPSFTAEDVSARMDRFLGSLLREDLIGRIPLLLISPPAMVPGAWITEDRLLTESARFASCYRCVADRHGVGFTDASGWNVDLTFDGVHFSPEGHRIFASRIAEHLDRAVN